MNDGGYAHRQEQRDRKIRQVNKLKREIREHTTAMRIGPVIDNYKEAYKAANGVEPRITYRNGWYIIGRVRNPYRQVQVERMTATLWARVHEKDLDAPEENA